MTEKTPETMEHAVAAAHIAHKRAAAAEESAVRGGFDADQRLEQILLQLARLEQAWSRPDHAGVLGTVGAAAVEGLREDLAADLRALAADVEPRDHQPPAVSALLLSGGRVYRTIPLAEPRRGAGQRPARAGRAQHRVDFLAHHHGRASAAGRDASLEARGALPERAATALPRNGFAVARDDGRLAALCADPEEAGVLVDWLGDGATIRSPGGAVVWHEGREAQPAAESWDFVAETVYARSGR